MAIVLAEDIPTMATFKPPTRESFMVLCYLNRKLMNASSGVRFPVPDLHQPSDLLAVILQVLVLGFTSDIALTTASGLEM